MTYAVNSLLNNSKHKCRVYPKWIRHNQPNPSSPFHMYPLSWIGSNSQKYNALYGGRQGKFIGQIEMVKNSFGHIEYIATYSSPYPLGLELERVHLDLNSALHWLKNKSDIHGWHSHS